MKGNDMMKQLGTLLLAASLTLTHATPVRAGSLSENDVGKLLFGLVAAATLHAAINNRRDDRQPQIQIQTHQPRETVNVRTPRSETRRLPRNCLRQIETRYGTQRMFTRNCLNRNFAAASALPRQCAVRVFSNRGPVRGFDPACLREAGYRARGH